MANFFERLFKRESNSHVDVEYSGEPELIDGKVKLSGQVYGRVQGVGFRSASQDHAKNLNIKGLVRNESDGSVYFEAVGSAGQMEEFIEILKEGPNPYAKVEGMTVKYTPQLKDFTEFTIDN